MVKIFTMGHLPTVWSHSCAINTLYNYCKSIIQSNTLFNVPQFVSAFRSQVVWGLIWLLMLLASRKAAKMPFGALAGEGEAWQKCCIVLCHCQICQFLLISSRGAVPVNWLLWVSWVAAYCSQEDLTGSKPSRINASVLHSASRCLILLWSLLWAL